MNRRTFLVSSAAAVAVAACGSGAGAGKQAAQVIPALARDEPDATPTAAATSKSAPTATPTPRPRGDEERLLLAGTPSETRMVLRHSGLAGPAVMVLGGVHGNEPGGWLATLGVPAPFALHGSLLAWYPEAGCWALLVTGFAGEYLVRRWRLRGIPHPGVRRFVTQIVRRWPSLLHGEDMTE